MLVKTIYREAKLYEVCVVNPADGLRTPKVKTIETKDTKRFIKLE
tara:strand:- start:1280 stop:1414 length:135 start_codon:yes stop_codon:yes gene_type:complete